MNTEQTQILEGCVRGALSGDLSFPEIVGRLIALGVERYHADYSRQEITYYFPDGDSLVVPSPHPSFPTAQEFSASTIENAVRQSQQGEHSYLDFIQKTKAAGCVGYFVHITGRRAVYYGRNGESHMEHFQPVAAT